jgi:hypothetical protein
LERVERVPQSKHFGIIVTLRLLTDFLSRSINLSDNGNTHDIAALGNGNLFRIFKVSLCLSFHVT